jgi:hypothetical protein
VRSVFHQAIRFAALEKWTQVPFQSCAVAQHSKGKGTALEQEKLITPKDKL